MSHAACASKGLEQQSQEALLWPYNNNYMISYEARYEAEYRFFEILVNMVNAVNVVNVVNKVIGVFFFMFSPLSPNNLLVNMVNMVNVVNMVNMLCYSFFQPTNCWQTW